MDFLLCEWTGSDRERSFIYYSTLEEFDEQSIDLGERYLFDVADISFM